MRGNEKVLFYFGFLRGKLSKILFLLFCAALVFPISDPSATESSSDAWLLDVGGGILAVVAILQLVKYCRRDRDDSTKDEPMMEPATKNTEREIMEESRTETIVQPNYKAVGYENQNQDNYDYNYDYDQNQNNQNHGYNY